MRLFFSHLALIFVVSSLAHGQEPPAVDTPPAHETDAESYHHIVETKLKHTYPVTAMRMLRECGNIQEGICIDIGCGTGHLDVELAKRSKLNIVGLDINPEMKPFFDQQVRESGLEDRVRFVAGDAQKLPFPDDHADIIVSRGVLIFLPDLAECLREVDRVLKPTGVAFLGGRYLYAPSENKMSLQELQRIVRKSGVEGAEVVDGRGQWVKIIGPEAPEAARTPQLGPTMLAGRFLADYGVTEGDCLLVCGGDGQMVQDLQQGFLELTELRITALYPSEKAAEQAQSRLKAASQDDRITCRVGKIDALPFPEASFDLVAGVGPVLIWTARQKAMQEIHRVLRPGGSALVGGRYVSMPANRRVSDETLRADARETGIATIQILNDMGQWVEIRKAAAE
jgi:ubiquinone/menaquinone biosynthesis C-methylase UbiE